MPGWQPVNLRFHRRQSAGRVRSLAKSNANSDTYAKARCSTSYTAGDHCAPDSNANTGAHSGAPAHAEADARAHSGPNATIQWISTGLEAAFDGTTTNRHAETDTATDAQANARAHAIAE